MDYNKRTTRKLNMIIIVFFLVAVGTTVGLWQLSSNLFKVDETAQYAFWIVTSGASLFALSLGLTHIVYKPLQTLFDVIVYAGHSSRGGAAPNTESLHLGRELITSLARQVYDLTSMSAQGDKVVKNKKGDETATSTPQNVSLFDHIGLPIVGLDPNQIITVVNREFAEYIDQPAEAIVGMPLYDAMSLSFQSGETFEEWLRNSQKNTAVGNKVWERVRIVDTQAHAVKQFDLVASFSKDNQSGTETMLIIYDRTEQYAIDDGEISFVSLAVHELRTPLTVLHGYIEVFEDELGPSLNPEMAEFMHKMKASAQQLTAFVGNILNVARVDENQLVLKLQKYMWPEIVDYAVADLQLRANVHGIHIEVNTANNLPPVAADQVSIHEVLNNLVENAIKYSGEADKILISSKMNRDGMIEVSVQDFGIGIPTDVMPDLFQKFYRSHKSRVKVGGTGLGLYLCKALVAAHGGNIWVRSKEGEGSIFTFTLQPYDMAEHQHGEGQDGIMRGAHGWIKNHSLNRQ